MVFNLPFQPIKGQAFKGYVSFEGILHRPASNRGALWYPGTLSQGTWTITKDEGTPAALTNAPVVVNACIGYISLTAAEMNADRIAVYGVYTNENSNSEGEIGGLIIYTTPAELSAITTLNSPIVDKITAMYQYFFNKRTTTTTQQKVYKSDGVTVLGTAPLTDDGTTLSKGQSV